MRQVAALITNGDDFGLSQAHNAGIIKAHHAGTLTSTSLMISGDAAAEAVVLAKRHPHLAVGLHLSFADVHPCLPADQVSLLVGSDGRFPADDRALVMALRSRQGRQQVRAEIAAQFEAFRRTGLPCDHVNTHRHVHLHPTLALMMFRAAVRSGVGTVRIPWDPQTVPFWRNRAGWLRAVALYRWAKWFGLDAPHCSIGRVWDVQQLLDTLINKRLGKTVELYFHPIDQFDHLYGQDLPSLLDPALPEVTRQWRLCTYRTALAQQTEMSAGPLTERLAGR